jgi:hypothetical protein
VESTTPWVEGKYQSMSFVEKNETGKKKGDIPVLEKKEQRERKRKKWGKKRICELKAL